MIKNYYFTNESAENPYLKNFHFLQVLAKKSAGVSWRGVLGRLGAVTPMGPRIARLGALGALVHQTRAWPLVAGVCVRVCHMHVCHHTVIG